MEEELKDKVHVVLMTGLKPKTEFSKKTKTGCRYNSHMELTYNKKFILGSVRDSAQNKKEVYTIKKRLTKKEVQWVKSGKDFMSTDTAGDTERHLSAWLGENYPNHAHSHAYWPQD